VPGHRPARGRYGVSEQVARRLVLALEPTDDEAETVSTATERLAGVVHDASGIPIDEARVTLRWVPPAGATPSLMVPDRHAVTADDGTFVVDDLDAGRYDVVAQADGYAEAMVSAAVPGPDVTLTLVPGVSLFGRVTDAEGAPLPSFAVVVTRKLHALASHTVAVEQALDPEGAYEVPHLGPGEYLVFAVAPGASRSKAEPVTLAADDVRLDFALPSAGTLAGIVVEREGGAPIAGAKVSLESNLVGDLQLAGSAFTDDEGAFTLNGMPDVPTSILVAAVDHHPRLLCGIVVPPGEQQDVRVDLEVVGEDEEPKIELAGIGAILQGTAEGLVINDVVDGGGAAEVGLGAGDVIVTIEGAEAADLGFGACIERLRGPEGSTVTVTVLHPGAEDPVVVVIPRRRIKA
ncbi:MAG: carboxypeptidase regulatory-like domain-containing protein, partial [Polyangiaceae bacterium]